MHLQITNANALQQDNYQCHKITPRYVFAIIQQAGQYIPYKLYSCSAITLPVPKDQC